MRAAAARGAGSRARCCCEPELIWFTIYESSILCPPVCHGVFMDNKLLKRLSVHSLIYTQLYKTEVSEAQHSDQEHARRWRGRQRPHSRAHPSAQRSPRKAARPTRSRRLGRQRAKSAAPTSMAAGGQQPSRR